MRPLRPSYRRVLAPIYHRPTSWFSRLMLRDPSPTSLEGIRSYADERVPPGRLLEMDVFLRDGSTLTALVEVEWCDSLPPGGPARFDVGMRIVQMEARVVPLLQEVLEGK
jgi:hypothetical protein